MFNEEVLQDLVIADPGTRVPTVDREMLEKPIQASIMNGKVFISLITSEPYF